MKLYRNILMLSLLFWFSNTKACVCDDWAFYPKLTTQHIHDTDLIFVTAKVVNIKTVRSHFWERRGHSYRKVSLAIINNYNLPTDRKRIKIATGMFQFGDCGFPFEIDKEYIIALTSKTDNHRLRWTSVCLPTQSIDGAKEELVLLEKAFKP